ncbi:hypothetical protein [Saccharothrix obliqua]|uniref:hypothetical protein n=1 Tax=Saccharothrix obliqua TaxID=2861747 RepID=UPI001C5FC622|nr:hypothetical protein [Saccharothrix obliqua]MBW4717840.1 hypothetical protein [Saccharothrix obliqua]
MTTAIRTGPADIPGLSALLGAALHDNPLSAHYQPDPERRRTALPAHFTALLTGWVRADPELVRVWTTAERDAITVWTHADHTEGSSDDDLADLLGTHSARRFAEAVAVADAHEPPEPHHTFQLAATDPSRRKQGLGTTVVAPGLAWCDTDHMPAYCWTAHDIVVPWLKTYGFRVIWTDRAPGGLTMYGAWRDPR